VQACPTGALLPATMVDAEGFAQPKPDREVDSVCPYCGVGCQITYNLRDDKIVSVSGRNGPSNEQRLCVKGRFGFDYITHRDRLMVPLIRKDGVPKNARDDIDPSNPWTHFRKAIVPLPVSTRSATRMAATRCRVSARQRDRTRKLIFSRSWCAPASAPTMSTTARGFVTPRRWRR
jgi:NADH dehydrogenase/NADH:ubiquinone oxidoreductase subunit G